MAKYQDEKNTKKVTETKFDTEHKPGDSSPYAGIYRCVACGDEIGIAKEKTLPPQDKHQHNSGASIRWKLLVLAEQK